MKRVAVIVVTYNGMKWLDLCLGSLCNSIYPVQVVVVDNASNDGTPAYIRTKYPQTELIETGNNLGFGRANNIGISFAINNNFDFVFLLNQDAWIENETIKKLVEVSTANPEFGVVSPMHLSPDKKSFEYKFREYIEDATCKNLLSDIYFNQTKEIYNCDFVNAAAWLIPIEKMKIIGGFDPIFPHYGEDVDFIQRIQYFNFKAGICPSAIICHDSVLREWSTIMMDKKRMYTIYLSEVKNQNSSLKSNLLIFLKNRFDDLTSRLLYRQFRLFFVRLQVTIKVLANISKINAARKSCKNGGAYLN